MCDGHLSLLICLAISESAWQHTSVFPAGSPAQGFLPPSPGMQTVAPACLLQGAGTSVGILSSMIRTGFTRSNYPGMGNHRLLWNTKSSIILSFSSKIHEEKHSMWRWLNMLKEDKMSQLMLERQQYSLRRLCCHSCKNRNILWVLIILIKVVLLFVWAFPERNTDFPIVLFPGRSWRPDRGQVCTTREHTCCGSWNTVKYPVYFKNAVTESNIPFPQIDSLETLTKETHFCFL